MVQQLPSNTFTTAKWIVSATSSDGTHTTIGAALTSASSGDTIFIRPGTYTENLTLKAGVNLTAFDCDSSLNNTGHVIISGKATLTTAGTVTISGIELQTNSDFFLAITGSANSVVNLNNCYLNALNNTGISYTSSGASSGINISYCSGNIGTTGISMHSCSGAGAITYSYCVIGNSGSSTTASTNSSGTIAFNWSNINFPISSSSTGGLQGYFCTFNTSSTNTTSITHAGSGASNEFTGCWISSGTATAVTITTNSLNLNSCELITSNTNAISGTGTLIYSAIFMGGSSVAMNPTSTTQHVSFSGGISFDKGTNNLNVYTTGTWTPTVQTSNGDMSGISYTTQVGRYTKIGNLVTVSSEVVWTNTGAGTGNLIVNNLPFTVKNAAGYNPIGALQIGNVTFTGVGTCVLASANPNTTNVNANICKTTSAAANQATAAFTNAQLIFTITYEV